MVTVLWTLLLGSIEDLYLLQGVFMHEYYTECSKDAGGGGVYVGLLFHYDIWLYRNILSAGITTTIDCILVNASRYWERLIGHGCSQSTRGDVWRMVSTHRSGCLTAFALILWVSILLIICSTSGLSMILKILEIFKLFFKLKSNKVYMLNRIK